MTRSRFCFLTIFFFIYTLSTSAQHDPFQVSVSVQVVDSVLTEHESADHSIIIYDIRTPGEYANGFIEGAINLNYYGTGFDDTLAALDKKKEYLIYCASGGRSAGAFNKMKALNFEMVYNMIGGVNAWKAAGFKLVTGGTGFDQHTIAKTEVLVYPNPVTSESKFILIDQSRQEVEVNIMNVQGQVIDNFKLKPGDQFMLDSDNLVQGLYFYQVYQNGQIIQTSKFLKAH